MDEPLERVAALEAALGDVAVDEQLASIGGRVDRLGDQLVEVEHLDALLGEHPGEGVMLALGSLEEGDVVEQEPVEAVGREVEQLIPRPVQHDRAQRTDLGERVEDAGH